MAFYLEPILNELLTRARPPAGCWNRAGWRRITDPRERPMAFANPLATHQRELNPRDAPARLSNQPVPPNRRWATADPLRTNTPGFAPGKPPTPRPRQRHVARPAGPARPGRGPDRRCPEDHAMAVPESQPDRRRDQRWSRATWLITLTQNDATQVVLLDKCALLSSPMAEFSGDRTLSRPGVPANDHQSRAAHARHMARHGEVSSAGQRHVRLAEHARHQDSVRLFVLYRPR
jgi:hypothetical protein